MATFKIIVQKKQRKDKKYQVAIRVTWHRKMAFIPTSFYALSGQITEKFELREPAIIRELQERIKEYEKLKLKLGGNIELYDVKELAAYFEKHAAVNRGEGIDFLKFIDEIIKETPNKGTAGIYKTIKNNLEKFTDNCPLPVSDITYKFLESYEAWLKQQNSNSKPDGHIVFFTPSGINLYLRTLRALFYKAKNHFNDEDKGEIVISHNPFIKFKIPPPSLTKKRNIKGDIIKQLRDMTGLQLRRDILGRDIFMISFYLLGMNTVDIFNATDYSDGRITYSRTKTKSRRQDNAVISVKVIPEVLPLIEKYRDPTDQRIFCFHNEYVSHQAFNKAVNIGLKNVDKELNLGVGLSSYYARHSFATIARNICGVSMLDIHEALNHVSDANMRVTDIYVEKDWSVIDGVQRKVVDSIEGNKENIDK